MTWLPFGSRWRSSARIVVCLTFVALTIVSAAAPAFAQQLVIVARHAERADGGSMAAGAQTDPLLSAAGEARAQKLAAMLADAGVTAIYTTEYKRTLDTAKPLAAKLGIGVQSMAARDTAALVAKVKSAHAKDVVLIVGHSNTMPAVIKAFGGGDVTMPDTDYDSLFIVVPATGTVTRIRY
jgi:broad specificity phosphatase PhoE